MKKQLISTTTVILLLMNVVNGIPEEELDMAITSLKANGYNLLGNAISTSDIRYQIVTTITNNITLFAPTDSDLYSLDLVSDSSDYVQKLRYHISLNQFSFNNLSSSSSNLGGSNNRVSYINTLIPHHCLTVTIDKGNPNDKNSSFVRVDGVRIVVPDLYTGSRITVHGLSGILSVNFRRNVNENVYSDLDLGSISSSTQSIQCLSSYVPPVNFPDPAAISITSFSPPAPPPSPDSLTAPVITPPPPSTHTISPSSVSVPVTSSIPDTTTASLSIPATTPAASLVASPGAIPSPIPVSLPVISPPPVPTAEIVPVKLKGNTDELDVGNKRERGSHYRGHHHLHHQHRPTMINAQKKFHRIRSIYDHHHEDFL